MPAQDGAKPQRGKAHPWEPLSQVGVKRSLNLVARSASFEVVHFSTVPIVNSTNNWVARPESAKSVYAAEVAFKHFTRPSPEALSVPPAIVTTTS